MQRKSYKHGLCNHFCTVGDCRESNWNCLVLLCVIMLLSTLTCLKCPSASTAEFAQELRSIRHFRIDCYQSSTCSLKKKKKAAGLTAAETLKWVLLGFFLCSCHRDLFASYFLFVNP